MIQNVTVSEGKVVVRCILFAVAIYEINTKRFKDRRVQVDIYITVETQKETNKANFYIILILP